MSESRDAILQARYLRTGESEEGMWKRVATQWATNGKELREFEKLFSERRALPNTPAIANAGLERPMGSACFVLPVEDDTDAILDTLRAATIIHKHGGGTGFDFSAIRRRGATVASTGREAPGPVEGPLKGYSEWLGRWSQAGLRPGANMGMLHVDHPNILDFIRAKRGTERILTNFNISVKVTDEFMSRITDPVTRYDELTKDSSTDPYNLWHEIIKGAWGNGEPGIYFEDTVNRTRLHPELIAATNPCGEVPLRPYEACVLGSINLAAHVVAGRLDLDRIAESAHWLTVLLDNIIELQYYPLPEIEREQKRYRKIGVGVMGVADALCLMGMEYGSAEALSWQEDVAEFIKFETYRTSEGLAHDRGLYAGFGAAPDWRYPFRRNLNCQVVAPTGSISRLAECSFGIEPHFDVRRDGTYDSHVVGGVYKDHNPYFLADAFKPAAEVSIEEHINTQAVWQAHVDQAVSKTINCPFETTHEQVAEAYRMGWETGCKGLTVLREGARMDTVMSIGERDCVGVACAI